MVTDFLEEFSSQPSGVFRPRPLDNRWLRPHLEWPPLILGAGLALLYGDRPEVISLRRSRCPLGMLWRISRECPSSSRDVGALYSQRADGELLALRGCKDSLGNNSPYVTRYFSVAVIIILTRSHARLGSARIALGHAASPSFSSLFSIPLLPKTISSGTTHFDPLLIR